LHALNAPYKHCHSTVSAAIAQCSGFLKNVPNFTHLPILTEINLAIAFTAFISSLHFEQPKNKRAQTNMYMSENWNTILSSWPW
jgi:hypothetical protein